MTVIRIDRAGGGTALVVLLLVCSTCCLETTTSPTTPSSAPEARASHRTGKDTYLEAYMSSHLEQPGGSAAGEGYPIKQEERPTQTASPSSPSPTPSISYSVPSYAAPGPSYGTPSPAPEHSYGAPPPTYGTPIQNYGPPAPSHPPAPVYGTPLANRPVSPVYGPPRPQYGPPSPAYGQPAPIPFFEGLADGLSGLAMQFVHLIANLPLPDMHTALKILLKVIIFKGVVKIVSMVLLMLFLPKLEDIMKITSSLLDLEMDSEKDKDKDKDKDKEKPSASSEGSDMQAQEEEEPSQFPLDMIGARAFGHSMKSNAAMDQQMLALAIQLEDGFARMERYFDTPPSTTLVTRLAKFIWPSSPATSSVKKSKKKKM